MITEAALCKRMLKFVLGIVACMAIVPAQAYTADELEKQLVLTARSALQHARQADHRNVGVLKFAVRYAETKRLVDGALSSRMAQQLERALVLQNDPSDPIGIVQNASGVAAKLPGVDHTSAEGRKQLFSTVYPLAWGKAKVVPDLFLSGVAQITPDRRRLHVATFRFDSQNAEVRLVSEFEVRMDLEDLIDVGESFVVRGLFDQAKLKLSDSERKEEATKQAILTSTTTTEESGDEEPAGGDSASLTTGTSDQRLTQKELAERHPLSPANQDSLVRLKILYDGQPQTLSFPSGVAVVRPPQPGQSVSLEVRRAGTSRDRLGVVLKINGENTLFRQTEPDARCRFWILEPHMDRFGVYAFHLKGDQTEAFQVLTDEKSAEREIDYGEFAGTISITVFGEKPGGAEPDETSDDEEATSDSNDLFALLRDSAAPEKTPSTLVALKRHFGQSGSSPHSGLRSKQERGLIVPGQQGNQKLRTQPFRRDPVPRMTATVRYYNPSDLPL